MLNALFLKQNLKNCRTFLLPNIFWWFEMCKPLPLLNFLSTAHARYI